MISRWQTGATAVGALAICGFLAASCGTQELIFDLRGDGGGWGAGGSTTSSGNGGSGGGTAMEDCDGVCIHLGKGTLNVLLWFGPEDQAPSPPERAPDTRYEGYTDMVWAPECEACTCGALNHTCTLPTSLTAFDQPQCPAGQQGHPFDAAPPWSGTCDDNSPLPAPNSVQSLSIAPLDLVESCAPQPAVPEPTAVHWNTYAVAFSGNGLKHNSLDKGTCADQKTCVPSPDAPPADLHLCMMHEGENMPECDSPDKSQFTEKFVFYWKDIKDHRSCTPCACTPPAVRGVCSSMLSVYKDALCSGPTVLNAGISSEKSTCLDVNPTGQPLGSKSATPPEYTPAPGTGTCAPTGGQGQGDVEPGTLTTFCCIPLKS